ncbi:MAG: hypothetical protein MJZ12_01780 [Prevotella sp.]|nr:hypothetical protein [Prevotella sp.]
MDRTRSIKFFSDIVPEAIIMNPRHKHERDPDVELAELMWEVFGSRGVCEISTEVADEYADFPEDEYVELEPELLELMKEVNDEL